MTKVAVGDLQLRERPGVFVYDKCVGVTSWADTDLTSWVVARC
jgi:hypothetical protein